MSPATPSGPAGLDALVTLIYELLDAHQDTLELAGVFPDDSWQAHLDYLRALQRQGRELLARTDAAAGSHPAEAMP
jgi:hypothetical protein